MDERQTIENIVQELDRFKQENPKEYLALLGKLKVMAEDLARDIREVMAVN